MLKIRAYTDGACKKNPGIGGWGWVAYVYKPKPFTKVLAYQDYGGAPLTTNQRMELEAMARFIEWLPYHCVAHVHSDSMYVLGGIVGTMTRNTGSVKLTSHPMGWMKGWLNAKNIDRKSTYWSKEPKNSDLWKRINEGLKRHISQGTKLTFEWVKGHSSDIGNDLADELSNIYPLRHRR